MHTVLQVSTAHDWILHFSLLLGMLNHLPVSEIQIQNKCSESILWMNTMCFNESQLTANMFCIDWKGKLPHDWLDWASGWLSASQHITD